MDRDVITVVSGLPRSGTSMMMQMLEAGGLETFTDNIRTADQDNLKGYYEFERVKELKTDRAWLADARGKVVKIISELLKYLPDLYTYNIVFMKRNMQEILASQQQMLLRRGIDPTGQVCDEKMSEIFRKHLNEVDAWLSEQPNVDVIYVDYNETLQNPDPQIERINGFGGGVLDTEKMADVIDAAFYRQRR